MSAPPPAPPTPCTKGELLFSQEAASQAREAMVSLSRSPVPHGATRAPQAADMPPGAPPPVPQAQAAGRPPPESSPAAAPPDPDGGDPGPTVVPRSPGKARMGTLAPRAQPHAPPLRRILQYRTRGASPAALRIALRGSHEELALLLRRQPHRASGAARASALTILDRLPPGGSAEDPPPPPAPPRPLPCPATTPGLTRVLRDLGATILECSATGLDEAGAPVSNQCLYLALAAAARPPGPLPSGPELAADARAMRRRIEAAVRTARPDWEEADFLGQEVGAFADFLIWGIPAVPTLRGRAVAVYHATEGTCEVFRPPDPAVAQRPVLALWFHGAHYQWVRWDPGRPPPRLARLLAHHQVGPVQAPAVPTLVTDTAG